MSLTEEQMKYCLEDMISAKRKADEFNNLFGKVQGILLPDAKQREELDFFSDGFHWKDDGIIGGDIKITVKGKL